MEYRVTTLIRGDTAGCSTFCDSREGVLREVRSSLNVLQFGERVIVERERDIDAVRPGTGAL